MDFWCRIPWIIDSVLMTSFNHDSFCSIDSNTAKRDRLKHIKTNKILLLSGCGKKIFLSRDDLYRAPLRSALNAFFSVGWHLQQKSILFKTTSISDSPAAAVYDTFSIQLRAFYSPIATLRSIASLRLSRTLNNINRSRTHCTNIKIPSGLSFSLFFVVVVDVIFVNKLVSSCRCACIRCFQQFN